MVWEGVLPAISKQILMESAALASLPEESRKEAVSWNAYIARLGTLKNKLLSASDKLEGLRERLHTMEMEEQSAAITNEGLPLCEYIRNLCDTAESILAGDNLPYPTYTKILSIS